MTISLITSTPTPQPPLTVAPANRVLATDFGRIGTGHYNSTVVSPGYNGARYALACAGLQGPNGPLEFGARMVIEPRKTYWVTAVVKGQGYGQYVYSPFLQTANSFNCADWTYYRGILRVAYSGLSLGATFVDISGTQLGYAVMDEWTYAQRATYSDWIMSRFDLDVPSAPGTLAQRLALAPNALDKIVNGGTLKVACVGDSLMADTCKSSWPELVMRTFPGLTIEWFNWSLNSTGETGWLSADKAAIYAWAPDLIYFGGISTNTAPEKTQTWHDLLEAFRTNIPGVEIVLGSMVRADPTNSLGPGMAAVAEANNCTFYPATAYYNSWLLPLIGSDSDLENTLIRDGTHFNAVGWEVAGRCFARFLGAEFP